MRRFLVLIVLCAVGLVTFNTPEYSSAQDGDSVRLSVDDFAPISPENVLYMESIAELDPEVDEPILSVQFSPENASFIATTEHSVMMWSVEGAINGEVPLLMIRDEEWLETTFSEDQGLVAIASPSGIEVWDTVKREQIGDFEGVRERRLGGWQVMTFTADGSVLVYQLGQNLRYWDTVEGVELASRLLTQIVWSVAFSLDGRYIALQWEDRRTEIQLLNSPDFDPVASLEHDSSSGLIPIGATFSPQGRWLFVYGEGLFVEVWDTATWTLERKLNLVGVDWVIATLAFSSDNRVMLGWGLSSKLYRWGLDEETGNIEESTVYDGEVTNVTFTPDSQLLGVSWQIPAGTSGEAVVIIDPRSGRSYVSQYLTPIYLYFGRDVAFNSDSRLFAYPPGEWVEDSPNFETEATTIAFFGVPNSILSATLDIPAYEIPELPAASRVRITSQTVEGIELLNSINMWDVAGFDGFALNVPITLDPDSGNLVWAVSDAELYLGEILVPDTVFYEWDFENEPQIIQTIVDCDCFVQALGYVSEFGLVGLSYDYTMGEIGAINVSTGDVLSTISIGESGHYGFSSTGMDITISEVVGVNYPFEWTVTLWNVETGEHRLLEPIASGPAVYRLDGEVIYGGGVVWDAETGELLHEYSYDFGYPDAVQVMLSGLVTYGWENHNVLEDGRMITAGGSTAISPDQSIIAHVFPPDSLKPDLKQIELVDTTTGERLAILDLGEDERGYGGQVYFTPDSTRLIYVSLDGDIRVWEIRE